MRDCHLGTQRATLSERKFQPGVEGMGPGNHHWVSGETFGRSALMRSNSGKVLGSGSSSTTVTALAGDAGWTRCQKISLSEELERAAWDLVLEEVEYLVFLRGRYSGKGLTQGGRLLS